MSAEQPAPLLDFAGLCALVRLGKDTVRKHLKSADPDEYWPHLRTSTGPKARYRFTQEHVRVILAKLENPGPIARESALVTTAQFDRALARRRRDRKQAA